MTRRKARRTRRLVAIAAVGAFVVCVLAQHGCVIAESSGEVPRLPPSRPTILHASVVPSTSRVLSTWPKTFVLPVELVDPTAGFVYASFVDYDPLLGTGLVDGPTTTSTYQVSNANDRVRTIEFAIPEPVDIQRCHVIEVVVALSLRILDGKTAHTPDPPGGDLVTWFYNPSGDLGGCPALDAGIDARPDGDAAEGGAQ